MASDLQKETSFLNYLQLEQPGIWASLQTAAQDGLVFIDKDNDSVTATNRLLLTYPDLHEVLNMITENWIRNKNKRVGERSIKSLLEE